MKPKVLFVLHTPPPVHGAAMMGKYVKESVQINGQFHTKYIRLGTTNDLKERKKTTLRKILRFFKLLTNVFVTSLKFRPNLVYMSITSKGIGFYKDALIVVLLKLTGSKLVFHFHNKGVKTRQNKFFDNLLYTLVFTDAYIILLSRHLYYDIKKYVSEDKVFYCPNGIPDTNLLNNRTNLKNDLSEKPVEILFLSNLIQSKGVYILIQACTILKEWHLSFNCVVIGGEGDIKSKEFKDKVRRLGLENNIEYVGRKYEKEKIPYFQAADIFVFPTYYEHETFGLVNLEAMQYSLPVISTFEGGIPDVVENDVTGFLIPKKNAQELAKKLKILIENPELKSKMGSEGRKKYLNEFTLEKFENNLTTILNTILLNAKN